MSIARRPWTRRRGALAIFGTLLTLDLIAGVGSASLAFAAGQPAAVKTAAASDSTKTVAWNNSSRNTDSPNYPLFENFSVTVGQTENLTNQGLTVSWTGGKATPPQDDKSDYVQLMQCWGDAATGPTPQQCQWGQPTNSLANLVGSHAAVRTLIKGEDPAQLYDDSVRIPRRDPNDRSYAVPFVASNGTKVWDTSSLFSPSSSNEITAARTGQDGSGTAVFEVQTALEAPHLGCGTAVSDNGVTKGQSCWLVVVPRGEFNPDGTPAASNGDSRVSGSPLSATPWADRVQVKLGFAPIGASCPIGRDERRTVGSELIADAFGSWQTALCATGTTYGYSEVGDSEARTQVVSSVQGAAGLAFVTKPLDATAATGTTLQYAPVAASGIVVGYQIDKSLAGNAANFAENGTPVTSLTLSPRLVAKLLTQSYQADVPNGQHQDYLSANPLNLRQDHDFLDLNPSFNDFTQSAAPDGLMVALGDTDSANAVWRWLQSDPDARDFLAGKKDPWGMVVNPAYSALNLATNTAQENYPKADLSTFRQNDDIPAPGYGTLDMRPYMQDMQDAAYATLKADANVKTTFDSNRVPPAFVSGGPQVPGARFSLSITDSTSAARYGLQSAKLVNSTGKAVAPTSDSITAGLEAMVPSGIDGVVITDPDKRANGAYPLSEVTYAAVNVCSSSLAALRDYNKLLAYAVGTGQVPGDASGQLPRGYVPLAQSFLDQAVKAETAIAKEIAKPVCVEHQKAPSAPAIDPIVPIADPVPVDNPEPTPSVAPTKSPAAAAIETTPASAQGATRFAFLAALLFAIPCLIAGPLLLKRTRTPEGGVE